MPLVHFQIVLPGVAPVVMIVTPRRSHVTHASITSPKIQSQTYATVSNPMLKSELPFKTKAMLQFQTHAELNFYMAC